MSGRGKGQLAHEVVSLKLRGPQTMRSLDRWDAMFLATELWGKDVLAKRILQFTGLPKVFCSMASRSELLQALHFNHGR